MSTKSSTTRSPVVIEGSFAPRWATLHARLVGITPLLMHSPQSMKATKTGPSKAKKVIPTPEDEAEASAYRDGSGQLVMPTKNIYRSITEAGSKIQNPDNKRATLKKVFGAALIPPAAESFPLSDPDTGELLNEYEIDVQRVVIQRAAIMRARPRFDRWAICVQVCYDEEVLPQPETVATALSLAGQMIGLGDFRPEKGGFYGRFAVDSIEVER
jgi:hypothetical protein